MADLENKIITDAEESTSGSVTPYQPTLFPIDIIETYPSNLNSADLTMIGKGRDGKHYAIKTIHDNNGFVPASEFFCHHLARLVSIPTPSFEHLQLSENEVAFGSTWEGGVNTIKALPDMIEILTGKIIVQDIESFFGKVYAFDLFVNNEDRHFGNYIFRDSFNKSKIALAFDFSRSWMETGPFEYNCLENKSKTYMCNEYIRVHNKFDITSALDTLDLISKIPKENVEMILNSMHETWMSNKDKDLMLDWWGSDEFFKRIEKLKGVI